MATINLTCSKHPKYGARRKPNGGCDACSMIWRFVNANVLPFHVGAVLCLPQADGTKVLIRKG
jgi:hypothetical protein